MTTFLTTTYLIAAGIWVGSIVFHSAVVAPSVVYTLRGNTAGVLLRTLFPRFYTLGLACGAVMLVTLLAMLLVGKLTFNGQVLLTISAAMVFLQTVSLWLVPHINQARDLGMLGARRFSRLHGISVALTLAVLVLGLTALILASSQDQLMVRPG